MALIGENGRDLENELVEADVWTDYSVTPVYGVENVSITRFRYIRVAQIVHITITGTLDCSEILGNPAFTFTLPFPCGIGSGNYTGIGNGSIISPSLSEIVALYGYQYDENTIQVEFVPSSTSTACGFVFSATYYTP